MRTIAVLGCGNMGGAIIRGIASGQEKIANIKVYDKDPSKVNDLCDETGCVSCSSEVDAVSGSDVVFVAVKPDVVGKLFLNLKDACNDKIIVSIATGVEVGTFLDVLGQDARIVRTIPNLPAVVGEGLTGLFFYNVNNDDKEYIEKLFSSFGKTVAVLKEEQIDEMIAVTSSSPAYICLFVEALADGAVRAGFSRDDAYKMALQTMYGTAKLMLEKNIHPAVLKDQVCSPGGTTIEGVAALENAGFRNAVLEAMVAVREKVKVLGKG
ncbi:MAG: pyrroline-5-carboxylate reductase [Clostridiaceae bacterium]|nr:pyrroline-5-carboxylate reductase [Clostridiaceae bacterium]